MNYDNYIDMKFDILQLIADIVDCGQPFNYEQVEEKLDCLLKMYINR